MEYLKAEILEEIGNQELIKVDIKNKYVYEKV